jgi:hypothetical protein
MQYARRSELATTHDQADGPNHQRISALWKEAAIEVPLDDDQAREKALLFRANFRVNILKALQATWETAQAAFHATIAAHNPFDPLGWVEAGIDAMSAVHTMVVALVESMPKIDFVTAVILANREGGLLPGELKKAVEDYLNGEDATKYAWYLGMTGKYVQEAAAELKKPKWFDTTIGNLEAKGFILRRDEDQHLIFQPQHYTIGWASE